MNRVKCNPPRSLLNTTHHKRLAIQHTSSTVNIEAGVHENREGGGGGVYVVDTTQSKVLFLITCANMRANTALVVFLSMSIWARKCLQKVLRMPGMPFTNLHGQLHSVRSLTSHLLLTRTVDVPRELFR